MADNDALLAKWLEEQRAAPRTWWERCVRIGAILLERCQCLRWGVIKKAAVHLGRRAFILCLRAPKRCAAGAAASFSGLVATIWMTLFSGPAIPTPSPAAEEFAGLSQVATSEIAPECPDATSEPAAPRTIRRERSPAPQPSTSTAPADGPHLGRPSPFYTAEAPLPVAAPKLRNPTADRIDQVGFRSESKVTSPGVWLLGTIEEVNAPRAIVTGVAADSAIRDDDLFESPAPATQSNRSSPPELIIRPR